MYCHKKVKVYRSLSLNDHRSLHSVEDKDGAYYRLGARATWQKWPMYRYFLIFTAVQITDVPVQTHGKGLVSK